jgi:diadenosine tetraphosphate (Ap4A) HIT family hydrolase
VTNTQESRYGCCFCQEFSPACDSSKTSDRVLVQGPHAVAFPSLGALQPGHVLIAPRLHSSSLSVTSNQVVDEVFRFADAVASLSPHRVLKWEHGTSPNEVGGCGIDHAHLHILPVPRPLSLTRLLADLGRFERIQRLSNWQTSSSRRGGYLYVEESDGSKYVCFPGGIPSQLVRARIARALRLPEWDWRLMGRNSAFQKTLSMMPEAR